MLKRLNMMDWLKKVDTTDSNKQNLQKNEDVDKT